MIGNPAHWNEKHEERNVANLNKNFEDWTKDGQKPKECKKYRSVKGAPRSLTMEPNRASHKWRHNAMGYVNNFIMIIYKYSKLLRIHS